MTNFARVKLGAVTSKIGSGATPRGGESVYQSTGVSLIRSQNVYDYRFAYEGLAHIGEEHARQLQGAAVQEGDILLNITGDSIGRCCLVPTNVLPARVNQHVAIIRPSSELRSKFLLYYINNPKTKTHLLNQVHGGTRKALTKGIIENFEFDIPPVSVQERIGQILGSLDDKIELNRRMNETLEQMAMALYKHWFVDFGPFQDGEFVESELGMIPKGWEVGNLGDIARTVNKTINAHDLAEDIPYIGLEHMPRGSIALQEWGDSSEVASNKFAFARGHILFGKLRPYFKKVGVAPIDGICSTDIYVLEAKKPFWHGVTLGLVIQQSFIDYCSNGASGTKMPRTNWGEMSKYQFVLPTDDVASNFDTLIRSFVYQIMLNVHENRILQSTRDYLLPRLLSGEIDLDEAKERVEEVV